MPNDSTASEPTGATLPTNDARSPDEAACDLLNDALDKARSPSWVTDETGVALACMSGLIEALWAERDIVESHAAFGEKLEASYNSGQLPRWVIVLWRGAADS